MYSIVLVEDEELIRKELIITIPWESVECRIIGEAEDGIQGESIIRKLKPDIVLTDIRLPGQSGLKMLEAFTNQPSIIFTGYADFNLAQQALRTGVFDYLLKPVDEEVLLSSVKKLCTSIGKAPVAAIGNKAVLTQSDPYVKAAMDYIDNHFVEDLSLYQVAKEIGISESHLSHLFKQFSGYTFLCYLQDCRLRQAIILLKNPRNQIAEVYRQCGFSSGSYFSRVFKRLTGVTPSEYRRGM